jgi:hypothetical protein
MFYKSDIYVHSSVISPDIPWLLIRVCDSLLMFTRIWAIYLLVDYTTLPSIYNLNK